MKRMYFTHSDIYGDAGMNKAERRAWLIKNHGWSEAESITETRDILGIHATQKEQNDTN